MRRFVEGVDRVQSTLFPEFLEDWICEDNPGLSKDDLPPPPYSVHHGAAEAASVPRTTVPRKMDAIARVRMISSSDLGTVTLAKWTR